MREVTFHITDYCPHKCSYCSGNAGPTNIKHMKLRQISTFLNMESKYDIINISGGEPLAHPDFYKILEICNEHAGLVVVHTNALRAIMYNANVIDGIRVEANLTVDYDTETIHVLKRIDQGREKTRPQIKYSHNYTNECKGDCGHYVYMPDFTRCNAPCKKE